MIGIGLILAHETAKHLAPLFCDPDAIAGREPLALGATAGAILGCSMGVHLDRDEPLCIIFRFRVLVDLAAQLVGLAAVHAPGFAAPSSLDRAEPLKKEDAAGILAADRGDDA